MRIFSRTNTLFRRPLLRLTTGWAKPLSFSQLESLSIQSKLTDHNAFRIEMNGYNLICANIMMRGKISNNGFGIEETTEEYQTRLKKIATEICALINAKTFGVSLQEFAIQKEDIDIIKNEIKKKCIPGWENPFFDITEFGVATCFKNGPIQNSFLKNENLQTVLSKELKIRCQMYTTSESYSIINTHVPFRNTEKAYYDILYSALKIKLENFDSDLCRVIDFCGDKNLTPSQQKAIMKKVISDIFKERKKENKTPIKIGCIQINSENGHQKIIDSQKKLTTVDSFQRFIIEPSVTQENEFRYEECGKDSFFYRFIALPVLVLADFLFESDLVVGDATLLKAILPEVFLSRAAAGFFQRRPEEGQRSAHASERRP